MRRRRYTSGLWRRAPCGVRVRALSLPCPAMLLGYGAMGCQLRPARRGPLQWDAPLTARTATRRPRPERPL
ncbi:hypothetical protein GCM10027090_30190 [Sinomonas soli]